MPLQVLPDLMPEVGPIYWQIAHGICKGICEQGSTFMHPGLCQRLDVQYSTSNLHLMPIVKQLLSYTCLRDEGTKFWSICRWL